MTVFVGDDWAEAHHDVHLMNEKGDKLAGNACGRHRRHRGLPFPVAEHADDPPMLLSASRPSEACGSKP